MNHSSESDFGDERNVRMPHSSNEHSGGVVVLAENEEEAIEMVKKHSEEIDIREYKEDDYYIDSEIDTSPIIIELDKKGVILYADGDC